MGTTRPRTMQQQTTQQEPPHATPGRTANNTHQETKLVKSTALRSSFQLMGGESGLKGRDQRHRTAPLTPLSPPTPSLALDKSDAVRDVKPPNLWITPQLTHNKPDDLSPKLAY